jgi:hypothetical protein
MASHTWLLAATVSKLGMNENDWFDGLAGRRDVYAPCSSDTEEASSFRPSDRENITQLCSQMLGTNRTLQVEP